VGHERTRTNAASALAQMITKEHGVANVVPRESAEKPMEVQLCIRQPRRTTEAVRAVEIAVEECGYAANILSCKWRAVRPRVGRWMMELGHFHTFRACSRCYADESASGAQANTPYPL
jgi:hypothetical protein